MVTVEIIVKQDGNTIGSKTLQYGDTENVQELDVSDVMQDVGDFIDEEL